MKRRLPIQINLRRRDAFIDGGCSCLNCRRDIDGTCPAWHMTKQAETVCDYYKIITPTFIRENGGRNYGTC